MAKVNLSTIKNWFRTGLKPTQAQFWDTWDSFRHKDDKVLTTEVDGLAQALLGKADTQALANHKIDANAHSALFDAKVDKVIGKSLSDNNLTDGLVAIINASNPLTGSRIIRGGFSILPNRTIRIFIYEYVIADVYYNTPVITDVQLDIGGAQDRADTIAINNLAQAIVKKGIEGDPSPPDIDIATELFITWRLMKAGATEPAGSTSTAIYNENLQEVGGEWDTQTYTAGAINPNGASNPSLGVKSVTVSNSVQYESFFVSHSVARAIDPDGIFQFKIFLENAWSATDKIWVLFYNGNTRIHSNFPTIKTGSYGFNGALLNEHQVVAIPFKNIAFTNSHFTRVQFFFFPKGKNFSLDEIQLFDATGQPNTGGGGTQIISRTSQIPINDGLNGTDPYATESQIPTTLPISIRDVNNIEQFKSDTIQFEGFYFDVPNKRIKLNLAPPNTTKYFVDASNGNDLTAQAGFINLPFKTIDAILSLLPNNTNYNKIILLTGETYELNGLIPKKRIEFFSEQECVLSFSNNPTIGELYVGIEYSRSLKFNLPNGTILFTPVGSGLSNSVFISGFSFSSLEINCKNVTVGEAFYFNRIGLQNTSESYLYININNLIQSGTFIYWIYIGRNSFIKIKKIISLTTGQLIKGNIWGSTLNENKLVIEIDEIVASFGYTLYDSIGNNANVELHLFNTISIPVVSPLFIGNDTNSKLNVYFYDTILDGEIWLAGTGITIHGNFTINNNTITQLFAASLSRASLKNGILTYNGSGHILNSRINSQLRLDNYTINMNNPTGYILYSTGGDIDYTAALPLLVVNGFAVIKHLTNNYKMLSQSTVASSNAVFEINGALRSNALAESDISLDLTIINTTPNLY